MYEIRPIGRVESSLHDRGAAPKQGFEGAQEAWLVFDPTVAEGMRDLEVGAEIFVLPGSTGRNETCSSYIPATTRPIPRPVCSARVPRIGPTRSASIGCGSSPSRGPGCACRTWRPSTEPRSWMSNRSFLRAGESLRGRPAIGGGPEQPGQLSHGPGMGQGQHLVGRGQQHLGCDRDQLPLADHGYYATP